MKLMTIGPTEIEKEILELGKNPMVYNRTSEFCSVIKEIDGNLKYVFNTKNQVFILTCSGTGAMEAAIVNTLSRNDEVVIANNGVFGQRWVEICNNYGLNVKEIKGTFGQTIDPEKIRLVITEDTKAVIITANETSSGTVSDVQRIGEVVKKTNSLLIVDAISDLCCDEFKTDEWHCDVVVVSSNKGLAIPPGLAFITFSEKAWKSVNNSNLPKYYFDIKTYQKNQIRGHTPFTPPIGTLFQLQRRLQIYKEEGLEKILDKNKRLSKLLREGVKKLNLKLASDSPSNGVTAISCPEGIDAKEIVAALREKYKIEVAPSSLPYDHSIFKVGVLGDIQEQDVIDLLSALGEILNQLQANINIIK